MLIHLNLIIQGAIHELPLRELPLQTEYSRDLVGNTTRIVNLNQTETTVAYDKVYRTLQRVNRQTTKGGKINSAYWHSYNDLGHITKTVNQYGWRKPSVVEESYSYDGLRRLSGFSLYPLQNNGGTVTETWNYDPAGNRLSWASNDDLQTNTPFDAFSRSYEYNEANQMLGMTHDAGKKSKNYAYGYSYDENGNRVNRQLADASGPQYGVDYSYDPENRLIEALDYQLTGKDGKNRIDRAVTSLEYDGGGRRLVQHYDPKNGGGGVDKRDEYVFDGLDPVAEYDKLNGQRTDYYRGEGGDIALMHQYKGGTQGQMYWYHYNNKKDVVGLTKQNGNSHHNYRYEPYGAVLPENGNFTDPHNHYTLTGKEFDENTGLVWFGARHYEPETGVWMGQDSYRGTLDEPMSLHRFGYVGDDPVNYLDLYGDHRAPGKTPPNSWPKLPENLAGKNPKWSPKGYWKGKKGRKITWDDHSHGTGMDRGSGEQDGHWDDESSKNKKKGKKKRWDREGNLLPSVSEPAMSPSFFDDFSKEEIITSIDHSLGWLLFLIPYTKVMQQNFQFQYNGTIPIFFQQSYPGLEAMNDELDRWRGLLQHSSFRCM